MSPHPSDVLKREATAFLDRTQLLDRLAAFGEPVIHGSYELDTMGWRELDILVFMDPFTLVRTTELVTALARELPVRDVHIIDQAVFPPRFASGELIILDLVVEFPEATWKLDLGIQPRHLLAGTGDYNAKQLAVMTPERLALIREIKLGYCQSKRYRRRNWDYIVRGDFFYSGDIYDAVLFDGVDSVEGFREHLRRKRGLEIGDPAPGGQSSD